MVNVIIKPFILRIYSVMNRIFFRFYLQYHKDKILRQNNFVTHLPGEKVLILIPHPDDEAIGCCGAILTYRQRGADVHLLFLTNGKLRGKVDDSIDEDIVALRRKEAQKAAQAMGICEENLHFLGEDDQNLLTTRKGEAIEKGIKTIRPDTIFLPCFFDSHSDHYAVSKILCSLYEKNPDFLSQRKLFLYEIQSPITQLYSNVTLDISSCSAKKDRILALYRSQKNNFQFVRDMNALHGLVFNTCACEIFLRTNIKALYSCFHDRIGTDVRYFDLKGKYIPHGDSRSLIKSYLCSVRQKKDLEALGNGSHGTKKNQGDGH